MQLRSLRMKITVTAGLCLLLACGAIVAFSMMTIKDREHTARERNISVMKNQVHVTAEQYAGAVRTEIEMALNTARTLAYILGGKEAEKKKTPRVGMPVTSQDLPSESGLEIDRSEVNLILKTILERHTGFAGIFALWEPHSFDGKDLRYRDTPGHDETGRFMPYWTRDTGGEVILHPFTHSESVTRLNQGISQTLSRPPDIYLRAKETRHEAVIDPYPYIVGQEEKMITTLIVPILSENMFRGIVGVDLCVDRLADILRAGLLSSQGQGASPIIETSEIFIYSHNGREIRNPKQTADTKSETADHRQIKISVPIIIGQTETPWLIQLVTPLDRFLITTEKQKGRFIRDLWKLIGISLFCICAALGLLWRIAETIAKPMRKTAYMLKDIAEGDLTGRLNIRSRDELGMLANWFDTFLDKFQEIIRDISGNVETLNTSSWDFSDISGNMKMGTDEISAKSNEVASATEEVATNINTMASAVEEMSVNIQSVSSTAEQMALNMNTLASAIEQLSSAINNIAQNAQEGAKVSGDAMDMAKTATQTMTTLGDAAMEIDEVTELIKKIAEQTNLLALNATIEAASAGEAGKGFAVVAKEIKELANQSSTAAENIAKRIKDVQKSTIEAVKVIDEVSEIINSIAESSTMIMNAVEQQTLTANNISASIRQVNVGAGNIASAIAEVAKGSNDMSKNAAEAARGANDVASNIQDISHAAERANEGAMQVNLMAGELAKIAGALQKMTTKFKVGKEK